MCATRFAVAAVSGGRHLANQGGGSTVRQAMTHSIQEVAGWIRQVLALDKRPVGLFLGAGCPCAINVEDGAGGQKPLIPAIRGLTEEVQESVAKGASAKDFELVMRQLKEDGVAEPNIEDALSHIRRLRSVAGKAAAVRDLSAQRLDDLDKAACAAIVDLVSRSLPPGATPYADLADWIASADRAAPVEVFTTNYDLLMEEALERARVPYFDGFVGAKEPFFEPRALAPEHLPPTWTRFWKLHGSVNWAIRENAGVVRVQGGGDPRVIHPSHLKYDESRRMPYLAMLDRLNSFLQQPSAVLITIGYSFGDQHINDVVAEALHRNETSVAYGLLRGGLEDKPIARALASRVRNLGVLAKDGAVLGGSRGEWSQVSNGDNRVQSAAIDWVAVDAKDKNTPYQPEFRLGDFQRLAEFLTELIGDTRRSVSR